MLTKSDREEIAEKCKERIRESHIIDYADYGDIYKGVIGMTPPRDTEEQEDIRVVLARIIYLCDTSNMVELPVDKDGEVIRIGDTVYKGYDKYIVTGYVTLSDCTRVTLSEGKYTFDEAIEPYYLTHKAPVTTQLLAQRIRDVLDDENTHTVKFAYVELNHIADILESLADNDE